MTTATSPSSTARRNRLIAIVAGAITVIAIVLGFAGDFLGISMRWMRPAAELLLLAELVGLVVLERHQLFEPVHETVHGIRGDLSALREELNQRDQRMALAGQTAVYLNSSQVLGAVVRSMREALSREQEAPQVLRYARLARFTQRANNPELQREFQEMVDAIKAFHLHRGSSADSKARFWTFKTIITMSDVENFDSWLENVHPIYWEMNPLNVEIKLLVRGVKPAQTVLTPNIVTDRDVVVILEDDTEVFRWGMVLKGRQYVDVFARWFDELWASIPDRYLVASRSGVDEKALDRIRQELAAIEASQAGQSG